MNAQNLTHREMELRKFALEVASRNFVGSESITDAARKYYDFLVDEEPQEKVDR